MVKAGLKVPLLGMRLASVEMVEGARTVRTTSLLVT
jgi:hypothetical protein